MAAAETLALKYGREMEREADQNGLHILTRAGYDPNGLLSFLSRLNKASLAAMPKIPTHLATHPETESRIAFLENLLRIEPQPGVSFKPAEDFRRMQMKAFVEERDSHGAAGYFESLIKTDPANLNAYLGLGLVYQKMGRLDKSVDAFRAALSISPEDPEIKRELGIASFLSGNVDQAIQILEPLQSLSFEKTSCGDVQCLYYLARAYQEKGDASRALSLFLRFRKEMPNFPGLYNHLGSVYGRMGQKGISHLYFGKQFNARGDRENALLHFSTALKWLDKESLERDDAEREIREITKGKGEKPKK